MRQRYTIDLFLIMAYIKMSGSYATFNKLVQLSKGLTDGL